MAQVTIKGDYLKILANSAEFQQIFASDCVLDELEKERENKQDDLLELTAFLGGFYCIENHIIKPITPAQLSILWLLESPFLGFDTPLTELDIDIVLFVLDKGKNADIGNIQTIVKDSHGFAIRDIAQAKKEYLEKTKRISKKKLRSMEIGFEYVKAQKYQELKKDIKRVIDLAFRAYRMFPQPQILGGDKGKKQPTKFNADWLAKTVSIVHQQTGLTPEEIMWTTPMTSCGYYYAQYARQNGTKNIEHRPDEETVKLIWERTNELCKEFLKSKGYKEEEFKL